MKWIQVVKVRDRLWTFVNTVINLQVLRKTCHSATLSTTNPKWIDPRVNPGLRGVRPATNDLSHGTANTQQSLLYQQECSH
jgi:hypothetical protein